MEMGSHGAGVAAVAYISDHYAPLDTLPFRQALRIPIQVGIVVAVGLVLIELVNREAAEFTEKKFADCSRVYRYYRRSERRHDIRCFVRFSSLALVIKRVDNIRSAEARNR